MPALKSFIVPCICLGVLVTVIACSPSQPEPPPGSPEQPTATATTKTPAKIASSATPVPTPTPIVSILIDTNAGPLENLVPLDELSTKEMLEVVERRFEEADSYVADVKFTSMDPETLVVESTVHVGRNHRAHGIQNRGVEGYELLYVQGISYERPTDEADYPWRMIGRGELEPITRLRDAIRGIYDTELVRGWEEDGRRLIELKGSFSDGSSGPPPIRFDRIRVTSSNIVLDAETLLPISIEAENIIEIRHRETEELITRLGWIINATIGNYGEVTVVAEHPRNLEPTPEIIPATATSTPTPSP